MYPSDLPAPPAAPRDGVHGDYHVQLVRIFGPERAFGVTVDMESLEMDLLPNGDLRVSGRVLKASGRDLTVGLHLVLVGLSWSGTELARRNDWTRFGALSDEIQFDLFLSLDGRRINELRILFEEKGPLRSCVACHRLMDPIREHCGPCAFDAYMRLIKGL